MLIYITLDMDNNQYDSDKVEASVEEYFMKSALPSLEEYIKIPNLSRHFDK